MFNKTSDDKRRRNPPIGWIPTAALLATNIIILRISRDRFRPAAVVSWEVFWGPGLIGPGRSRAYLILFECPNAEERWGSRHDVRPPDRCGQPTGLGPWADKI